MRAIINRKRYDTEQAERIVSWDNALPTSDFNWQQEDLYRTRSGAYFLHGQGGALSSYRQPTGNNGSTSGERITPFTAEQTMDWLEQRELVKYLEDLFGAVIEDA